MSTTFASRIIRHREQVTVINHAYDFDAIDENGHKTGSGYSFGSNEQGEIVIDPEYADVQRESLRIARELVAAGKMREVGHVSWPHSYWEPAEMRCDCGRTVVLDDGMTNQCGHCGAYYNGSGQALNPPEMWEPEDRYAVFGPQNAPDDD
jgi:hypothetical protein